MSDRLKYNPADAFSSELAKNLSKPGKSRKSGKSENHSKSKNLDISHSSRKVLENNSDDMVSEFINRVKKEIMDELRYINKRLDKLEKQSVDVTDVKQAVSDIKKQMDINEFTIGADDDLKNYMMSAKDGDMTESVLTGGDIAKGADKINSKRRNRR